MTPAVIVISLRIVLEPDVVVELVTKEMESGVTVSTNILLNYEQKKAVNKINIIMI